MKERDGPQVAVAAAPVRTVVTGAVRRRPPVKRRLFTVAGAQQQRRVRLSVNVAPQPPEASAPLLVRTQSAVRSLARCKRRTTTFTNRYGSEPTVWLKVGDREVFDFKISVGERGEVMASELCDLDTKQTVVVRSSAEDSNIDCSGLRWQGDYPLLRTPPNSTAVKQEACQPGGDCSRHVTPPARPRTPRLSHAARPDGDGSSLLWLLDYRLDHLLVPPPEEEAAAPAPVPAAAPARAERQAGRGRRVRPPPPRPCSHSRTAAETSLVAGNEADHDYKAAPAQPGDPDFYASTPAKPPFTYTELIEQAMVEEGELTVSGIYRWITSHFAFYKSCDDRWKNSVRHNLSMSPYFRKGDKASNGTGHLWMLAHGGVRPRRSGQRAKQRSAPRPSSGGGGDLNLDLCDDIPFPANDIWLSSAAADCREAAPIVADYDVQFLNYVPEEADPPSAFSLEESAERILSGSSSQVEVQYITSTRGGRIASEPILADYQNLDVGIH